MRRATLFAIFILLIMSPASSRAGDVNINLFNLNSADQTELAKAYSKNYGFSPAQIIPALAGPATEIPLILQIAKSAGALPLEIWSMRKLGLSYANILKHYALPSTILVNPTTPYEKFGALLQPVADYTKQYKNRWPSNISLSDPVLIELGKLKHFTNYVKIPSAQIVSLPADPSRFVHLVLEPHAPSPYFIPPGQAKKMGLWEPPGQAKKREREERDHPRKKEKRDDDFAFFKKKYEKWMDEEEHHPGHRNKKGREENDEDEDHPRHRKSKEDEH